MKNYDLIVIGTGAANIVVEAAQYRKLKVAQIERGPFGGTCLNRGCIPTKILTTTADRIRDIQNAAKIGFFTGEPTFDWQTVTDRVWDRIGINKSLEAFYENDPLVDVYRGTGYFLDDHTVQVDLNDGGQSEKLTAPKIVIATGSVTKIPPMEGLEEIDYITSESFFGDKFPKAPYKRLIIVGGGAIGCEYAHVFSSFGSEIVWVQHNVRLSPKSDPEASQTLLNHVRQQENIELHLNKRTPKIRQEGEKIILTIEDRTTGELEEVWGTDILICPGVRPFSELLQLENTSIRTERGAILTNEFLETNVPGIYALGDINGKAPFRHKANYEADILAQNIILHPNEPDRWRWASYDILPSVIFTYPEVSQVGMTEDEAKEKGYDIEVGYSYYSDTAKGYALGVDKKEDAWAKVIVEKDTQNILGFHAIGPWSSMLIQPFHNMMASGTQPLKVIHEDIASPEVQKLRAEKAETYRDPHSLQTMRESLVAHPSLQEVGIWTFYDIKNKELDS